MIQKQIEITEGEFKGQYLTIAAIDEEALKEAEIKVMEMIKNANV